MDANCTLIDAITSANTDTDTGGCVAVGTYGNDIINLPANSTQTLSVRNGGLDTNAGGSNGLPIITSVITLNGNGSIVERSLVGGTPNFRIFSVATTGANLTLNDLTIRNGNLGAGSTETGGNGAGIAVGAGGTLTLNRCTVTKNNSEGGQGGGGMFVISNSTATLNNSTLSGNNTVNPPKGSGVTNNAGVAATVIGGTLRLNNSTVTGNTTNSAATAGIVVSDLGTVILHNTLIAGNTGGASPGVAPELTGGGQLRIFNSSGTITSEGHNLIGDSSQTFAQAVVGAVTLGATDRVATSDNSSTAQHVPTALANILNTTLANNGGLTQTHALVAGSPAIDASDAGAATTDQRGYVPAAGDTVRDIGAYEFNGIPPPPPTLTALSPTSGTTAGGTTVTITGTNFIAGGTSVVFGTTTIPAGSVTVNSAGTSLTVSSPAHAAGGVNVTATTASGTTAAQTYTYMVPAVPGATAAAGGGGGGSFGWLTLIPLGAAALRRRKTLH